jgi:regulator of protease activity HflC (stomatin/prohibitin superfamily)
MWLLLITILAVVLLFVLSGLRMVQQYERGVIFVLGRLTGAKGPGLFWIVPFISRMEKVDLRIVTLNVPPQEVITRDNITIRVTAVIYFYVVDPVAAVVNVQNYLQSLQPQGSRGVHRYRGCLPCATQPMEVLSSPLVLASKVRPVQSSGLPFLRLAQRLQ